MHHSGCSHGSTNSALTKNMQKFKKRSAMNVSFYILIILNTPAGKKNTHFIQVKTYLESTATCSLPPGSKCRIYTTTMRFIIPVLTAALLLVFTSPTLISAQTQSERPSVALTIWTLAAGAATYVVHSFHCYSRQTTVANLLFFLFLFSSHPQPGSRYLGMGV